MAWDALGRKISSGMVRPVGEAIDIEKSVLRRYISDYHSATEQHTYGSECRLTNTKLAKGGRR